MKTAKFVIIGIAIFSANWAFGDNASQLSINNTASTVNIDINQWLHLDNFAIHEYQPSLNTRSGQGGFRIRWTAKNNSDARLFSITTNGSILFGNGFNIENANMAIDIAQTSLNGTIGYHTDWYELIIITGGISNLKSFSDGGRGTPDMEKSDFIIYDSIVDAIALDTNEDGIYDENDKATLQVVTIPNAPVANSLWGVDLNECYITGYSNQQFAIIYDSDFNCDGIVNLKDFATLTAGWLDEYDITDLEELAEFWLK